MAITKIFIKNNVRIYLSDLQDLVQPILDQHNYLPLANLILAHALSSFSPLACLYDAKKMLIKIKSNGPIEMLLVEIENQAVRALVANGQIASEYDQSGYNEIPLILGLGNQGTLHISRIINNEQFTSEVNLVAADIITDLAYYLNQSDQTFSAIVNDVYLDQTSPNKIGRAVNVIFQLLPGYEEADVVWIEEFIKQNPLKNYDLATYEELLATACIGQKTLIAQCWCSRQRLIEALDLLTPEAQKDLFKMDQEIESKCDFCQQKYLINQKELTT